MNGEQLLQERTARNWVQNKTAAKLKVSQLYLSLLEAGKRPVTERLACRAARVFDLPLADALPLKTSSNLAGKKSAKGSRHRGRLSAIRNFLT